MEINSVQDGSYPRIIHIWKDDKIWNFLSLCLDGIWIVELIQEWVKTFGGVGPVWMHFSNEKKWIYVGQRMNSIGLNSVPTKIHVHSKPYIVTLLRGKVFADILGWDCILLEISNGHQWLTPYEKAIGCGQCEDTQTQREEDHRQIEKETEFRLLQAKKYHGWSTTKRS